MVEGLSSNTAHLARIQKGQVLNDFFPMQYLPLVLLATWGWSGLFAAALCCVYGIFRCHNNNISYAWSVRFLLYSGRLAAAESLLTLHLPQRGESLWSHANLAIITHDFLASTLTGCTRASTPGLLGNFTVSLSSTRKRFLCSPKLTLMLSLFWSSSKPWFGLTAQNLVIFANDRPEQLIFWSCSVYFQ